MKYQYTHHIISQFSDCRDTLDTKDKNESNTIDIDKEGTIRFRSNNEFEDDSEELPTIVKEGKDFRNELPDRLYLDSDPEFHLNVHIVFSYLLLYQVDSHILMVVRRIVIIYLTWMLVGIGIFTYGTYYPLLLDEPFMSFQLETVLQPVYLW